MKKLSKLYFSFLGLVLFAMFWLPAFANASTQDFVIENFDGQYTLDSSVPGGKLSVKETIDVNFSDNNHGIYRALPKKYKGNDTKLKIIAVIRDGANEKYETSTQNDNLVLKIGEASSTITGKHEYKIVYEQIRVVNFDAEKPEFYWDINGDQWQQSFTHTTASVSVRDGSFKSDSAPYLICYTGSIGSKLSQCSSEIQNGRANFATLLPLSANQTLTVGVPLIEFGFSPPQLSTIEKLKQNKLFMIFYYAWPSLFIGVLLFIRWLKFGKDYKDSGVIVPEFQPPGDLTPAEVGMLADYNVDSRDLSATIIDLAVRGYIRIHEDEKHFLFFKWRKYSLELLKDNFSDLKPFEKEFLELLFSEIKVGNVLKMSDLSKDYSLATKINSIKKAIKNSLVDKYQLVETNNYQPFMYEIVVVVVIIVGLVVAHDTALLANAFPIAFLFVIAFKFMPRRSHAGVETYEKIMGLKMYMNLVKKDRFKMTQSVDRPYAEPTKTPELFEKLLPYAVALKVEKTWAKQFDGVLNTQPDWVATNAVAFSSINLASSIGGVTSSFASSFSSSSGASGGSAGGGGGGGGGGGW